MTWSIGDVCILDSAFLCLRVTARSSSYVEMLMGVMGNIANALVLTLAKGAAKHVVSKMAGPNAE